ncbi:6-O-methylguanine DNA methyltransferase, DNA binding domain protein [Collinsella stercoris DSM 13279]|uniref:6-O-methylguanine DNA methyltransferase, DNA binding domain protein n=1 Tax=Collinsella stercoris DSM 13279 TaxID=445975 RepID=B6G847_9ACTN|nr:methylated-DNA--[protein]-cysteine S-methyltransferase [Collinsella stercoris]EEA91560.1 6-O-methylguanine DNA methyltransferase, DNA binding domain protein [Collinsella stercoris DSM 13279]
MITTTYHSPLGDITLAADAQGLTGLWFVGQSHYGATLTGGERSFDMQKGAFSAVETDAAVCDSPVVADEVIEGCDATSGGNPMSASDPQNTAAVSVLERAWAWLNAYFAGQAPRWTPPLHVEGTEFQHAVWVALLEIPYGQTVTYGDLARKIGDRRALASSCGRGFSNASAGLGSSSAASGERDAAGGKPDAADGEPDVAGASTAHGERGLSIAAHGAQASSDAALAGRETSDAATSARAVGAAVARNPVSIIIPCHRVVGADGALTGYAGGLGRKRALLELESAR